MVSGLIVPDTNVLLDAYRFAPASREELLSVLERIADRIWVSYRVAEEFHKNRLEVISDHEAAYMAVIDALKTAQQNLDDDLRSKINQLANRVALSATQKDSLLRLMMTSTQAAMVATEELRRSHGIADLRGDDPILTRFQMLLDGKTGPPFTSEELQEATAEAQRRIDDFIPPGYRDAKKKSEPYGDYFIWRQTLSEVARTGTPYVVFVTRDIKEDWYKIVKGRTVGAQPALVKEVLEQGGGTQLVMLSTSSFLYHAREYLNADVSAETIRQSEALPQEDLISEQTRRQERARRRREDLNRLERRIATDRSLIQTLESTLDNRLLEDPEALSFETRALRQHITELRRSERILRRRYERLVEGVRRLAEDTDEDVSTVEVEDTDTE